MKPIKIKLAKNGTALNLSKPLKDTLMALPTGAYTIEITKEAKARTLEQNNFYWSILNFLEKYSDVGYTEDEWHELFKDHFLKKKRGHGELQFETIGSTKHLTTEEFALYLEKIFYFTSTKLGVTEEILRKYWEDNALTYGNYKQPTKQSY